MIKLLITAASVFFLSTSNISMAHGGGDPTDDIKKQNRRIEQQQSEFSELRQYEQKVESLEAQLDALSRKSLALRKLMAGDYPHINENMSKYKMNYIEVLDDSLVQVRTLLNQLEEVLEK